MTDAAVVTRFVDFVARVRALLRSNNLQRRENVGCLAENAHVGDDHDDERHEDAKPDDSHGVRVRTTPLDRADSLVADVFVARPTKHWRQREQRGQQPDPCTQTHQSFHPASYNNDFTCTKK